VTPLEIALVVVVVGGLVALSWVLAGMRRDLDAARRPGPDPVAELLQRQIEAVRAEGRAGQDGLRQEVGDLGGRVRDELGALRLALAGELKGVSAEVTKQLGDGMRLFQSAQATMGDRLDRAAQVVGEVQGSLGKLGEATQRVADVGREIQGLEQVLRSPKIRGGLGETLLEQVLSQMLPREHWALQHGFRSGDRVDAVVLVGGRMVSVDAKFPLENFRRMLEEPEEDKRRPHRKQFGRDVKARVDEIAKKYILPDEGTFDFALMYVPAENVYYEIIVSPEEGDDEPISSYALARRVIPVSPNSFYAYLQVIVLGLRGLRIEASARDIQDDLARLTTDLGRMQEHMGKLGAHLGNAQKQYTDAERALARFEAKLGAIGRAAEGQDAQQSLLAPPPAVEPL
jgi:DNA recombination protein RmuC